MAIFSIGCGRKEEDKFLRELNSFKIEFVIDVRSNPYSRWVEGYNRENLERLVKDNNIDYLFMGNVIGGKPLSNDFFDEDGFYDYKKMAEHWAFSGGLSKIKNFCDQGKTFAILCAEQDPLLCHRTRLIGRELYFRHGINTMHIIGVDKCISQIDAMIKLTKGEWNPNGDLFGSFEDPYFKSSKPFGKIKEDE